MSFPPPGLKHGSFSVLFPARVMPLHAVLTSCGFSREVHAADASGRGSSQPYDWHGLRRGRAEFVVLQYTVAGCGSLTYEGRTRQVGPGSVMAVRIPHDHRYCLPPSSEFWEFVWVCMSGRDVVRAFREIARRVGPLVDLKTDSRTVRSMLAIYREARAGTIDSAFRSSAKAYSLTMALLEDVMPTSAERRRPDSIRRVLEYCRAHLAEPIDIDRMAAVSGYSRFHFCRLFRQSEKTSPGAYLANLRMRRAMALVQAGSLSVKEVATRCGYSDANYFCKAFRKAFGASPGALRKSGM